MIFGTGNDRVRIGDAPPFHPILLDTNFFPYEIRVWRQVYAVRVPSHLREFAGIGVADGRHSKNSKGQNGLGRYVEGHCER